MAGKDIFKTRVQIQAPKNLANIERNNPNAKDFFAKQEGKTPKSPASSDPKVMEGLEGFIQEYNISTEELVFNAAALHQRVKAQKAQGTEANTAGTFQQYQTAGSNNHAIADTKEKVGTQQQSHDDSGMRPDR